MKKNYGLPRPHSVRPRNDSDCKIFILKYKLKGTKFFKIINNLSYIICGTGFQFFQGTIIRFFSYVITIFFTRTEEIMSWIYLTLAIIFETSGTTALKLSNGFSVLFPSIGAIVSYGGLVLVDKSITEFKNDGIYVIALDDALYVKRLQILPGRKLKVNSTTLTNAVNFI